MKLKGTKIYAAILEGKPEYISGTSFDINVSKKAMDSRWDKLVEFTITKVYERSSLQEIETDCDHE